MSKTRTAKPSATPSARPARAKAAKHGHDAKGKPIGTVETVPDFAKASK